MFTCSSNVYRSWYFCQQMQSKGPTVKPDIIKWTLFDQIIHPIPSQVFPFHPRSTKSNGSTIKSINPISRARLKLERDRCGSYLFVGCDAEESIELGAWKNTRESFKPRFFPTPFCSFLGAESQFRHLQHESTTLPCTSSAQFFKRACLKLTLILSNLPAGCFTPCSNAC